MNSRVLIIFSLVCFFAGNTFGARASERASAGAVEKESVSAVAAQAAKDSTIFDRI